MSQLTDDLRDLAIAMAHDGGWSDDDIDQLHNAADMLDFFFGQMQMHSPKMDGNHSYRFKSSGWPMTHCVGPNSESAVMSAIEEIKRESDSPSILDAKGISEGNTESVEAVRKLRDEWDH